MASLNPNGQSPLAPVICYAAANTNQIQNSTWKCQLRFPNRCNHGFGLGLMASITCCASAIRACANSVSLGATCALTLFWKATNWLAAVIELPLCNDASA